MTATAQKIVTVNDSTMQGSALYRSMRNVSGAKVAAMVASINAQVEARMEFESNVVRSDKHGMEFQTAAHHHKDIQTGLMTFANNEALARLFVSQKIDPVVAIFPQSKEGGKSSVESSSIKMHRKMRQIAETIYFGRDISDLEGVAKIFLVCAFKAVQTASVTENVLERKYAECFLNSPEFRSIRSGAEDLFDAIDGLRATQMTGGGAATQASQMIRCLVALDGAVDVQQGRSKNVRIDPNNRIIQAVMRRLGQVVDAVEGEAEVTA